MLVFLLNKLLISTRAIHKANPIFTYLQFDETIIIITWNKKVKKMWIAAEDLKK